MKHKSLKVGLTVSVKVTCYFVNEGDLGKVKVERTDKVKMRKVSFPGSRQSNQGNILTYFKL